MQLPRIHSGVVECFQGFCPKPEEVTGAAADAGAGRRGSGSANRDAAPRAVDGPPGVGGQQQAGGSWLATAAAQRPWAESRGSVPGLPPSNSAVLATSVAVPVMPPPAAVPSVSAVTESQWHWTQDERPSVIRGGLWLPGGPGQPPPPPPPMRALSMPRMAEAAVGWQAAAAQPPGGGPSPAAPGAAAAAGLPPFMTPCRPVPPTTHVPYRSDREVRRELFEAFPRFLTDALSEIRKLAGDSLPPDLVEEVEAYYQSCLHANLIGGKTTRGIAAVQAAAAMATKSPATPALHVPRTTPLPPPGPLPAWIDDHEKALLVGWLVELLQAGLVILDDVMDSASQRRGGTCWYLALRPLHLLRGGQAGPGASPAAPKPARHPFKEGRSGTSPPGPNEGERAQ